MPTLSIDTPATTATAASVTPQTNSPLLRRDTSVYSTCSTGTPVLYYTKLATPLNGRWADECSPEANFDKAAAAAAANANVVPPMAALEQQHTDADFEEDMGSEGHTDSGEFAGDDAETTAFPETPVKSDDIALDAAALNEDADDDEATATDSLEHVSPSEACENHFRYIFRYNPYSAVTSRVELYRCTCDACIDACHEHESADDVNPYDPAANSGDSHHHHAAATASSGMMSYDTAGYGDFAEYGASTEGGASGAYSTGEFGYEPAAEWHDAAAEGPHDEAPMPQGISSEVLFAHDAPAPAAVEPSAYHEDPYAVDVPAPLLFVPPPPPPRISKRVLAEGFLRDGEASSATNPEAKSAAESIFYHVVMRWFSKVEASQRSFVGEDDLCPTPDEEKFSFDEWVDAIGRWWLRHFEHAQKKHTPPPMMPSAAPASHHHHHHNGMGGRRGSSHHHTPAPSATDVERGTAGASLRSTSPQAAGARLHLRSAGGVPPAQPHQPTTVRRGAGGGFATHTSPSSSAAGSRQWRRDAW